MSNRTIQWEPYKAACDANKNKNFNQEYPSFNSLNYNNSTQTESINKESLVRYKVDTDLNKFNAKRPGSQFDDSDLQLINKPKTQSFQENFNLKQDVHEFKDARFYTDFYFLKLANELKTKCLESTDQGIKTTFVNKPVNVVSPLTEKKPIDTQQQQQTATTSSPKTVNRYEARIDYLEDQIKGIYEQLQIQTQVNVELKKLLVASIGDSDTAYKLERLINDKQRYEYELVNMTKDLDKMTESVEQISIRCDMWRSKFLACKLMNEEASTWKTFLLMLNNQNEKVLKNLLNDNEMLNDKLNQALELLSEIKQGNNIDELTKNMKKNYNSLQATNLLLVGLSTICKKLNRPSYSALQIMNRLKTSNELIAYQMLEQFDWVNFAHYSDNNAINSFDKLEQLVDKMKLSRATIHSRLYQTTEYSKDSETLLNVCNHCKGQIKTV